MKSDLFEPTDLFKLPQDSLWERMKGRPKSNLKKFKNFLDKAIGKGAKINKPDFDKLAEDYR